MDMSKPSQDLSDYLETLGDDYLENGVFSQQIIDGIHRSRKYRFLSRGVFYGAVFIVLLAMTPVWEGDLNIFYLRDLSLCAMVNIIGFWGVLGASLVVLKSEGAFEI